MASKDKGKAKATSSEDVSSVDASVQVGASVAASGSGNVENVSTEVARDVPPRVNAPRLSDISTMLDVPEFKDERGQVPREWLRKVEMMRDDARVLFGENTMVDAILWNKMGAKFGGLVAAWYDKFRQDNHGRMRWEEFKLKFEEKYLSAEKLTQWRTELHERSMKADETPEQYVEALRVMQRMVGCSDDEVRIRFLLGLPRGLRTKVDAFELTELNATVRKAQAIYKSEQTEAKNEVRFTKWVNREEVVCRRCGGKGHIERFCGTRVKDADGKQEGRNKNQWRTKKVKCFNCGNSGHMAKDCRVKNKTVKNTVRMTKVKDTSDDEERMENEVETKVHLASGGERFQLVRGEIQIGDAKIEALIDSGANTTLVREDQLRKIGSWKKVDFKEVVRGIGGMADIRFWIKVKIGFGGKMTEVMAAVMDDDFDEKVLVGLDVLIPLKAKLDLEKMEMRAKDGQIVKITGRSDSRRFYVVAAKTERLEPGKIKWIVGNVESNEKETVNALVMAADAKLDVPNGVFTVKDGEMELPIMNRDSEEKRLKRGERIAHWREVEVDGKMQQSKKRR